MARLTSSSNRSKRKTKKPVTQGQNPQRANRQKVSTAKVTSSSQRFTRGAGETENPKITRGQKGGSYPTGQYPKGQSGMVKRASVSRAAAAKATLRGGAQAAAFMEGVTARNTAKGTLKGKPTGPAQGPKVPNRLTSAGVDKMKFDDAFRQARKAGQKKFTWRGKQYTTEMK
jgi:hypothetical protein